MYFSYISEIIRPYYYTVAITNDYTHDHFHLFRQNSSFETGKNNRFWLKGFGVLLC